jgi:RNA polymerase sigma-70 factor (ECF subfamily)
MDDRSSPQLAALVEEHYSLLYRFAFRLTSSVADAEDLTQQAFLTAQRKLDQLRDPSRAKSWLCSILRNTYLKDLRSRAPIPVSLANTPEPADEALDEATFDEQELQDALQELPEEYCTPIILFYFEEFSYKEIAEQMQVPIGTVMSRLARAKCHLRRRLTVYQVSRS